MTELVTIHHVQVTIEHAQEGCAVFVHGTPYAQKMLLPNVHRTERFFYLIGALEPNFPLPVTTSVATSYRFADRGCFIGAIPDFFLD